MKIQHTWLKIVKLKEKRKSRANNLKNTIINKLIVQI